MSRPATRRIKGGVRDWTLLLAPRVLPDYCRLIEKRFYASIKEIAELFEQFRKFLAYVKQVHGHCIAGATLKCGDVTHR